MNLALSTVAQLPQTILVHNEILNILSLDFINSNLSKAVVGSIYSYKLLWYKKCNSFISFHN